MPKHGNDRAVFAQQLLESIAADDLNARRAPDELEVGRGNPHRDAIDEQTPAREAPSRFRAARGDGCVRVVRGHCRAFWLTVDGWAVDGQRCDRCDRPSVRST